MRRGLRSQGNIMAQEQIAELEQQIANLNRNLRDRDAQIEELQELVDQVDNIPENPIAGVNIDEECQKGRIPDLIKNLPVFSGNSKQINHWLSCADRVVKRYNHLIGTDTYELWLMEVRNKITGEAGDLLASSGTPLDWAKIKNQLKLIYGDKRELSTLLQKLFVLKQNRDSVRNFYTSVSDCYTGISTHIQMDAQWNHPDELVRFVDKLCLEKFVDGLDEPYSSHVGLLQPTSLSQAYQYANDKANKIARRNGDYEVGTNPSLRTVQNPSHLNTPTIKNQSTRILNHSNFQQNPSRPINFQQGLTRQTNIYPGPSNSMNFQPNPNKSTNFQPNQNRTMNFQPNPNRPMNFQPNFNKQIGSVQNLLNRPTNNFQTSMVPGRTANSYQGRFPPRQNHELSSQEVIQEYQYPEYEHPDWEPPIEEHTNFQDYSNYVEQEESHEDYTGEAQQNEVNFQTDTTIQKLS